MVVVVPVCARTLFCVVQRGYSIEDAANMSAMPRSEETKSLVACACASQWMPCREVHDPVCFAFWRLHTAWQSIGIRKLLDLTSTIPCADWNVQAIMSMASALPRPVSAKLDALLSRTPSML